MTATDAQVRIIMRERQKDRAQEQAAASANPRGRETVAKYERLEKLPSELKQPRSYRTRPNSFAEAGRTLVRVRGAGSPRRCSRSGQPGCSSGWMR
jgi:hypothetical protein